MFGLGDSRKSETGNVLFSFGDSVSDDYVVYDGLGHVVGIVASSTGKMRSEWEYDVFGGVVKTGRYLGKLLYSSKYHDLETGLIYFSYRYYSPQNGRWINRDLIEEKGGVNVHALAKNDGLNYFDSLGLKINMINEGIDDYLSVRGVTGYQRDQSDLQYVYSGGEVRYGGLVAEILSAMIKSGRQFRFYCRKDLELHVRARVNTVNYVRTLMPRFGTAADGIQLPESGWSVQSKNGSEAPLWNKQDLASWLIAFDDLQKDSEARFACGLASQLAVAAGGVYAGYDFDPQDAVAQDEGVPDDDWIPGEYSRIKNVGEYIKGSGLEAEHILYVGGGLYWGWLYSIAPGETSLDRYMRSVKRFEQWKHDVDMFDGVENGSAEIVRKFRGRTRAGIYKHGFE